MYKKDKPVHRRITDCIAVKRKTKIKKKMIIPKQRDFSNHKAVKKTVKPTEKKVAEKDNIIIRYDEKKIKEKDKKKQKK